MSQNYVLEAELFTPKNEIGGACNIYGEEKRCILRWGNTRGRYFQNLGIGGTITAKWVFKE